MGRAAIPLAIVGGSLLLPGVGSALAGSLGMGGAGVGSTMGAFGISSVGSGLAGSTAAFSWSSLGSSLFSAKGFGVASGLMGMASSYQSMNMMKYGYKMQEMQLAEERRLRTMQANIDEADAMRNSYRAKQSAMAKAAAYGRDVGSDRSFMAYLNAEDQSLQREIDNIRVNAGSANRVSGMQMAGLKAKSSSATTTGALKIGRGFFDTASSYMET